MKITVAGIVYDANELPVMIQFEDDAERRAVAGLVRNMDPSSKLKIAFYPDSMTEEEVKEFMKANDQTSDNEL